MVSGINHVTFAVRDLDRSFHFYTVILGLRPVARWYKGAYLDAGGHWVCLNLDPETKSGPLGEYTHLAFTVPASVFEAAVSRLRAAQVQVWQKNKSPGDSFDFLDPDGHKLELYVATQQDRLKALLNNPPKELMLFPIP